MNLRISTIQEQGEGLSGGSGSTQGVSGKEASMPFAALGALIAFVRVHRVC